MRGVCRSQSWRLQRCCRFERAPSHALKHLPRFDIRHDEPMKAAAVLLLITIWQTRLASAQTSTCSVSVTGTRAGAVQAASIACSGPTVQMTGAEALQTFSAKFSQGAQRQVRRGRSMCPAACGLYVDGTLCRTAGLPRPGNIVVPGLEQTVALCDIVSPRPLAPDAVRHGAALNVALRSGCSQAGVSRVQGSTSQSIPQRSRCSASLASR